jgi:hypothetical protein
MGISSSKLRAEQNCWSDEHFFAVARREIRKRRNAVLQKTNSQMRHERNGYMHKFYECVIHRTINKFPLMEGQHCDSPIYKYSVAKL